MPMSGRVVLGVDLDGVCADYTGGLRPVAAEWLGVREETLAEAVTLGFPEWELERVPGGYEALHRFALTQRDLFVRLAPMAGARQALRCLVETHGVRVRIITNRLMLKGCHRETIGQTVEWLDRNRIPYSDLCFVDDKRVVEADLYVEDNPRIIRALAEAGKEVIAFGAAGHEEQAGVRSARCWAEMERLVVG